MKKSIKLVALFFCAILCIIVGVYFLQTRENLPVETDSGWLVYTDDKYNVSFEYPSEAHVQTRPDDSKYGYNVLALKGKGPRSPYATIWLSTIPKDDTSPLNCIDKQGVGYTYTTTEQDGAKVYVAMGSYTEPQQTWSIVCVDRDGDDFVTVVTNDYTGADIATHVAESLRF